jgi:hypothetical protein
VRGVRLLAIIAITLTTAGADGDALVVASHPPGRSTDILRTSWRSKLMESIDYDEPTSNRCWLSGREPSGLGNFLETQECL